MEIATLFTEQKWSILKHLSREAMSPLQIAEKSNTTMANISQQLKLLEAANLVSKQKIRNRDKGKPRTMFSLMHDYAYIISTTKGYAQKTLVMLNSFEKLLMRAMVLDENIRYFVQKFLWNIEEDLDKLDALAFRRIGTWIEVVAASNGKGVKKLGKELVIKKPNGEDIVFKTKVILKQDFDSMNREKKGLFSGEGVYILLDKKE